MKANEINILVVDQDPSRKKGLRNYLEKKFGAFLNLTIYSNRASLLENVDHKTGIVVLDYNTKKEKGHDALRSIKNINPDTKVLSLSANDHLGKGKKTWRKISFLVYKTISYPVLILVKEFAVRKYLAIFLLTFLATGLIVYFTLRMIP